MILNIGPWSASTSPARSPSPVHAMSHDHQYGTTSLDQRSRSPSPMADGMRAHPRYTLHPHQHSYPVLMTRRNQRRKLPPTPNKPSSLQLKPANINFPRVNASPTRGFLGSAQYGPGGAPVIAHGPMSFEQAVAMGRGGRLLPSPVPNGYKPQPSQPKQRTPQTRNSDSDDDDWC